MRLIIALLAGAALCARADDAAGKARRAGELVLAGKVDEAISLYRELVRENPKDAGILTNLAIAEFKAKRFSDAARDAQAARALQPESLAANLFLGSSYVELGEYAHAVAPLEKALTLQPEERNAHGMLAEALLALDRSEEAAAHFQKTSELAPRNPKAWYGLGRSYEALAGRAFHELEASHSGSPYWHALAGDQYFRQRKYGLAFANYRLAAAAPGAPGGVHASLAAIYKRTGHLNWAEIEEERERQTPAACSQPGTPCDFSRGLYREVVLGARAGNTPEALYWLSRAYAELARQAYSQLAQLPPSVEAHVQAAKTLDVQGLHREAAGEWREALKLAPGDPGIKTDLAWSLFRARDFDDVLELLGGEHGSSELSFLAGASLMNLEQPEKAIAPLENALGKESNFLPAQAALGQALLRAGKPAEAIPHLRAALTGDEDGSVHFQLLRAYQLTGQTERASEAAAEYQKARRLAEERSGREEGAAITGP